MTYFIWAATAGALAVLAEVLFRKGFAWLDYWWLFIPLAIAINYAVYRLVTAGPTLLVAIAIFSLATIVLRAGASQFLLGEPLVRGNLVAAVGLAVVVLVGHVWK